MTYDYVKMAAAAKKAADALKAKSVIASIKTSRYQKQIKAVEVSYAGSIENLLEDKGFNGTVSDLSFTEEKNISGKYKAKLYTIKSAGNSLTKNESFFIVNTYTEKGSIKTKDLAPDKLGLTVYTTIKDFDKAVVSGIENLKIDESIKEILYGLHYDMTKFNSNSDTVFFSPETKKLMALVKSQDKQAIGKDFGEILSLRWYITQDFAKPLKSFGFSTVSNEALVDFYVVHGKIRSNISAKFEAGAAPSIKSIMKDVDKIYDNPKAAEKKAINVLKALASEDNNTSTKILQAYEALKLPALTELKRILLGKENITLVDISNYIQSISNLGSKPNTRIKIFKEVFNPLYEVIGKTASPDSLETVFANKTYRKYYSLIMSPMGYALVSYMNSTPIFQDVLNNLSRNMTTEQVYLNFTTNGMKFEKKLFSEAEFKFAYGANAKDSDNTGIKFSMK